MDVEHEGVTIPRRRPRRPPVGLPYSPPDPALEALLEDSYAIPGWVWLVGGAALAGVAIAAAAYTALAVWFDRVFNPR